jgi:HTH-type transcriptional regulator / antitoxin HigA
MLQFTVIKSDRQYKKYCDRLEVLLKEKAASKIIEDEIELLTLLIETYEDAQIPKIDLDPVQLLKGLLKEHKLKAVDLATLLNVSEGLVSDMLKYKKGFSKETVRVLADRFKMRQEAFNRPYSLVKIDKSKKVATKKSSLKSRKKKRIASTSSA